MDIRYQFNNLFKILNLEKPYNIENKAYLSFMQ